MKTIFCQLQLELDDDGKLRERWQNKKRNAARENIPFSLTFDEFCQLVKDAELMSSRLGFKGEKYVLARYNDHGGYEYGNCRFITQRENIREKKISSKMIESGRRKVKIMQERRKQMTPGEFSLRTSEGIRASKSYKKRIEAREQKEKIRVSKLDPRWAGEKNSAYGCRWVTDGEHNILWNPKKGSIPEGYHIGKLAASKAKKSPK